MPVIPIMQEAKVGGSQTQAGPGQKKKDITRSYPKYN
jgi:hypothetical protein